MSVGMTAFLSLIGALVAIAIGYWALYEAGANDQGPIGVAYKQSVKKVRSTALVPVRKAAKALVWVKVAGPRAGVIAAEQVARRIDDAATRQTALLEGRFPPATKLVTDRAPFDYGRLWDECLAAA